MSVVNSTPLLAAAGGDYQISRSVRLRSSASAYFNRTPASAGTSTTTSTFSAWVKRGALGSLQNLISSPSAGNSDSLRFSSSDQLEYIWQDTGAGQVTTTQVFRDPSAWYHVAFAMDTTQATAANRFKLYVNGVQVTAFATASYPAQNTVVNNAAAVATKLGQYANAAIQSFDGYLTEINFIDGQALTPSSFGETDVLTGVWKPKKYTGTYGTNGFYLNFSDNSAATAAAIGADSSGNGNDWTPNNISVTAGATYDSMIDVPTPYADGGNGRGNYCTLNPVGSDMGFGSLSNGNLTATTNFKQKRGTIGVNTGKWYWEVLCVSDANPGPAYAAGVVDVSTNVATNPFSSGSGAVFYYANNGNKYINGTQTSYGSTYTTNDVIGVALDMDSGTVTFYKNNTSQGSVTLHSATAMYVPLVHSGSSDPNNTVYAANFGQRPFAYTPPTGFKALNTQNLPESTIVDGGEYFNSVLYTGSGSTQTINVGFDTGFTWIKRRNSTNSHLLADIVRGNNKVLLSNDTSAEITDANYTSFVSNGFSVSGNGNEINNSGAPYVAWNWKANGAGVSNTDGSITSTVSANPTAGFSVVTYTGNATNNATIGHGLGVAPAMVITKNRAASTFWYVFHKSLPATNNLYLNTTDSQQADNVIRSTNSTTFTVSSSSAANGTSMVAYCFSEVAGYSKFGSYTGNGSADGPFVFCGFRPRFVLIKNSSASGWNWFVWDTARNTYNESPNVLLPNDSGAELTNRPIDILSNGFKIRATDTHTNGSGNAMIFAAFAEHPFKTSLAR
jgi:hypothetical protein